MSPNYQSNLMIVIKLILNQIVMSIFGFFLSLSALNLVESSDSVNALYILAAVISTGMYWFLVYNVQYQTGSRDAIRASGGRLKLNKLKGLWLAALAAIPNAIVITARTLLYYFAENNDQPGSAFAILEIVNRVFLMGMYTPIERTWFQDAPLVFVVFIFPAIAAGALFYIMGTKDIRILKSIGIDFGSKNKK